VAIMHLLVVDSAPPSLFVAAQSLSAMPGFSDLKLVVLTRHPEKFAPQSRIPTEFVKCSFATEAEITAAIAPFVRGLCGVVCRQDGSIQYLRKLVPLLPKDILVSTPESLARSTNKQLMRESFARHCPDLTPSFIEIYDDSSETITKVEQSVGYPVIVKPANLMSSFLIQSCRNREQLEKAVPNIFGQIKEVYSRESRKDRPQVIVESYLEGDFYSVDAYVMNEGEVYFCPPVAYIPAEKIGVDDFCLYKRFVPTELDKARIASVNEATAKGIQALGLTHTSTHVELVLTKQGWKIIEIGPRLGRFRHVMYKLAYGIDHSLNDMLIHVGQKPKIHDTLLAFCSAYSIYPDREGTLREIEHIEELKNHPLIQSIQIYATPGDACVFAKNGGRALAQFVVASDNKEAFDELTEFIGKQVHAVVD
jgi:D-alanine-D-alanine ligase-like ATP-grasp enzyme